MKLLYLIYIISAFITTAILQEPPPVFDLPPPPPVDPPVTEEKVDQTTSSPVDEATTSALPVSNETLTQETNETAVISETTPETNETAVISDTVPGMNDSSLTVTDMKTSDDSSEVTAVNETLTANATDATADILTDSSVLENASNVTGVEKVENNTDTSNLTVTLSTDSTLSDVPALTVEEEAINDTNALPEIKTDNMTSADTSNMTVGDIVGTDDSNSTSENISTSLDINATDSLIQTEPVDLPPPPIPFDIGPKDEFSVSDAGANVTDTQAQLDMNFTSTVDSNETVAAENKTYIDEFNIDANDTGISFAPGNESEPKLDLPAVPVDVPTPPQDKPAVDFIESSDSTTIEISDLFGAFAGLGPSNKVSTPMGSTVSDTTTQEMPLTSPDSTGFIPALETTTQGQSDGFTTQPTFVEYDTTKPGTKDPSYTHVSKEEIAPTPDHPPPIFSGGSRPSVYTDPYGPHAGYFPVTERPTTPKPVITKQATLPPIIVPTRSDSRPTWLENRFERTTASPYPKWLEQTPTKQIVSGLNPRHMNVAELAAYALQIAGKKGHSNQSAQGIQVFFPTEPQTTTARTTLSPVTTVKSISGQQGMNSQQDSRSNAFVEYLRNKYGLNNVAPTTPYYTTTVKPVVRRPEQRKFYDAEYLLSHLHESTTQKPPLKKFFDSSYLLSHLDMAKSKQIIPTVYTTTQKPTTTTQFFDAKYLLSHLGELQGNTGRVKSTLPHKVTAPKSPQRLPQQTGLKQSKVPSTPQTWLNNMNLKSSAVSKIGSERIQGQSVLKEQRQGQVETRPINLKPTINQQSFINYNVNPERNVRMNINLKPDINQWREQPKPNMFTQPPEKSSTTFARLLSQVTRKASSFKPVVYGTKPVDTAQQSAGLSLRERFNKKWYHPEDKVAVKRTSKIHTAIKNTNVQIEPSKLNQANVAQSSRGNTMLRNTGGQNIAMQNAIGEFALQHTNIEVQRQILKEQESKLRQQQQQLQAQEAILLRQQQEQQRQQQQQNQQLLLQQQERDRMIQMKLQQEMQQQQQQKQQGLLTQQKELDQLVQQRQELQRQQQQKTLLHQQDHDRLLQLQLQRQLQLEQRHQPQQEKRNQQLNTQNNEFPLASRTGQSEVLSNSRSGVQQRHHTYQPNVQLSSIQIFRAPAMLKKRRNKDIQHSKKPSQTHWRAPSDLQNLHGHLAIPYNLKLSNVPQTTTAVPKPTTPATPVFMATVATTTVRPTTQPPLPTVPATADPNPPPIFDIKVRHTFMPMPQIDPTTKAPKPTDNAVTGWGETQAVNTQIDERCRGCVFVNDRCLLPDPVHCNFFIECVKQGNLVRAFSRECALGSFFDRKSFLCVDPKNADCPTDRCRIPGTKWYAIHGHCKHYWSCGAREGGGVFAQSECCPDMGGFVEPDGCVENPNCTDTCSSPIVLEGPPGCQLRKTASPTVYFDGNANIERPCAPGTLFNEQACTCVQDVSIERSESRPGGVANCTCRNDTSCPCSGASQAAPRATSCIPMLSLPFDGGRLVDASNTKQHIGVEGISATLEGEAIYNGAGRLVLWRYANLMFPVVFAIKFRFYSTTPSPRQQIIFSNCDTKSALEPSIEISLDTLYHEVVFNINTYKGPSKRFTITYKQNKWTTVDFIYDGERIVGSVDRRARNIFAGGGIETRPNPIGIGSCNGKDGFKGLLDDIFVYEECIPDEMYGVFMSVLE